MFATLISALLAAPHFPPPQTFQASTVGASRSLGLGAGGTRLFSDDATTPDLVAALWLEGGWLADDAVQVFLAIPLGIGQVKFGAPTVSGAGLVLLTGGQLGVRYLFLSDSLVRPVLGAHLTGLYVPTSTLASRVLFGPGAHAGLELDAGASVSLRLHGSVDWFIALNGPQRFSVGGALMALVSF
jgi:hypothetical protein